MCTICLDTIIISDDITKLPCKHTFHNTCFDMWSSKSNDRIVSCPNCRYMVRKKFKYTNPPDFVILFDEVGTKIARRFIILMLAVNIIMSIIYILLIKPLLS